MIRISRHIEILLLCNDCVIVPGLGGFVAHYMPARYDEETAELLPPYRTLGFNPSLTINDHLLVQSYVEAYDISYPEALRMISDEVAELRQHIETEGSYELLGIGELTLQSGGTLEFTPCEAGILTPQFYGFGSVSIEALLTKRQPTVAKPRSRRSDDAIVIPMSWVRGFVAAAIAIIAFFFVTTPVSNSVRGVHVDTADVLPVFSSTTADKPSTVVKTAEVQESETVKVRETKETTAKPIAEKPIVEGGFTIVMASQTTESHAAAFVGQLKDKGFADGRVTPMKGGMMRVVYGSYTSEEDARAALSTLRKQDSRFASAWVMKSAK